MRIFLITIFLACFAASLQAKTVYISDELQVPLRKSPCPQCAILHRGIKSGTALKLIEANGEGWSRVTTPGGMNGWMPSHYLQSEPTARDQVATVKANYASLQKKYSAQNESFEKLKLSHEQLTMELESDQSNKERIIGELNTIKKISANAVSINQQNKELLERNGILKSEIDILTATNERLSRSERNTQFLYGVFAVVMGALLTVLIPRLKRRKRFSEWS